MDRADVPPRNVLTIDDLVESILVPAFDPEAHLGYWMVRGLLLRQELGLMCLGRHRDRILDRAIESVGAPVFPVDELSSVPWSSSDVLRTIQEEHRRVRASVRALQGQVLREVMVAVEPACAARWTTTHRLVTLGLPLLAHR